MDARTGMFAAAPGRRGVQPGNTSVVGLLFSPVKGILYIFYLQKQGGSFGALDILELLPVTRRICYALDLVNDASHIGEQENARWEVDMAKSES